VNGGPQLLFAGGNTVEVLGLTVKDLANGEDLTKCWGHRHGAVVPIGSNEGHAARRE
jgi:prolyl-tRNA editing enzyme YbaK/EbsC (Cys-tRNA(Pro) deacylase)